MQRTDRTKATQYVDSTKQDRLLRDIPDWAWWHFRRRPYEERIKFEKKR